MIVYLSLKQIILNQIAVLIRKQSDKSNDDPERLLRRLNYLQQALEQIKSYHHNSNFQYVIKHFNIELSESEQEEMRQLSILYDDSNFQSAQNKNKRNEKSGFTTQRSETLFTGAAEEQYGNFYAYDNDMDDEKTPHNNSSLSAPQWIHYKGFAHWLKKQSFIKFKKRNDTEKYRKIWNTVLGLNLINQWEKGRIKPMNIIGRYGTIQPYIAIHKCGNKEIVKASLLRLSITQNRIFKFNIDTTNMTRTTKSRARRSIDMDNEQEYNSGYTLSANELIQGRNLFDLVSNKDVLRIVATMLWDTNLANNVLEELLHNPRFSMYGIHADKIADTIAKEMRLNSSYEETPPNNINVNVNVHNESVAQFALPSPQRAVSLQKQKEINQNVNYSKGGSGGGGGGVSGGGQVYSPQFEQENNGNVNSYKSNNASNSNTFSFNRPNDNKNNKKNNNKKTASDHARYEQQKYMQSVPEQEPTPSPDPKDPNDTQEDEQRQPHHKAHSASVVFHDNIRDSEINDYGAHNNEYDSHDGDDDESVSNSAEIPQHR